MYRKSLLVLVVVSTLVPGIFMTGIEVHAQGIMKITGDSHLGCIDREYYEKLVSYVSQGDKDAFRNAANAGLRAGVCTDFKKGEEVFLTDTAIFRGLIKVRRKGETKEYWTAIEAAK